MKNTIYLVTGAAGFLGSNVCSQLLERGDKVRAFVLPNDPAMKYVPGQVEICEGDLCEMNSVERFLTVPKDCNSVLIHCASMVTVNPDYDKKLMNINVGGTKNLVEACQKHLECLKMVYVSSTGAIPEAPRGDKIKEVKCFEPINPERVVGCYSQSKAKATQVVLDAVHEKGLNACVVHPSGILGPNDHAISETTGTLIKIMKGKMPIGMKGSFNLCDVRDLAAGCIAAADKGRKGECYILANEKVTLKELCEMLYEESGCEKIKFYLPLGIANIMAKVMERKAKKTGEKPLMTTFSVYNLARNNSFDYSKAKKELGYRTRSYAETIRDEVAWLKAAGQIV
ncbi:MAG: NAD-dependent epimerase/dehydratase family protein [Ruminococcus sp.]|nr:NAD-dependent epimerase/dehydratase family protein [Ruminococcus sp.]